MNEAEQFVDATQQLRAAIVAAIEPWCDRALAQFHVQPSPVVAQNCRERITTELDDDAKLNADQQRTTPLGILRSAYREPTAHLLALGIAPVQRDPFDIRQLPDDIYALSPRAWSDLGDEVQQAGITWGAAKAFLHLQARQHDRASSENLPTNWDG